MKKRIFSELAAYLVLPVCIWVLCRGLLDDYYVMLLSVAPGFLYAIVSFLVDKQRNLTGIFVMAVLAVYATMDLVVNTAESILWNTVYVNTGLAVFWALTIIARRPMAMYFFVDIAYMRGVRRDASLKLFKGRKLFGSFMWLTAFFMFRDITDIILRVWLIDLYGVEGYPRIVVITQMWLWMFVAITIVLVMLMLRKIERVVRQLSAKRKM